MNLKHVTIVCLLAGLALSQYTIYRQRQTIALWKDTAQRRNSALVNIQEFLQGSDLCRCETFNAKVYGSASPATPEP